MIIGLAVMDVLQISILLQTGAGTLVNLAILGVSLALVVQILNVQHAVHLLISLILLLVITYKLL
jgi:hypothetical protein